MGTFAAAAAVALCAYAQTSPPAVVSHPNITYASGRALDVWLPQHDRRCRVPAVLFVHGGGWSVGDKSWYAGEARSVAALGWAGITLDYRQLPKYPFPAAADDVVAAVRFLRAHAAAYGLSPSHIAIFGGSAGGNLAAYVAALSGRQPLVRAAVSWSGLLDLPALATDPLAGMVTGYVGCASTACPGRWAAASPTSHVTARSAPILLVNGSDEFVPVSQATALAADYRAHGAVAETLIVQTTQHDRGYSDGAWSQSIAFLARFLGVLPRSAPR